MKKKEIKKRSLDTIQVILFTDEVADGMPPAHLTDSQWKSLTNGNEHMQLLLLVCSLVGLWMFSCSVGWVSVCHENYYYYYYHFIIWQKNNGSHQNIKKKLLSKMTQ